MFGKKTFGKPIPPVKVAEVTPEVAVESIALSAPVASVSVLPETGNSAEMATNLTPALAEPVAEVAASTPPVSDLTPSQQLAIDKIMAKARDDAQQILLSAPLASLGTPSGDVESKQEVWQRDHIPGAMRKDKTYIPEFVYDEHEDVTRRVLLKSDYKYVLVLTSMDSAMDTIQSYLEMGYKHCLYDGGSRSGFTERGFKGTGDAIFRRTIEGYCQRGDCRLMWIPIRGWEALNQEDQDRCAQAMPAALGSFANAGYSQGIRTKIEVEGVELT